VEVRTGGRTYVRQRRVGEGYLGNFEPRLHFGLPATDSTVDVAVRWPSGSVTTLADVSVDQQLVISEP
jgi:hypothetical protein